MSTPPPPPPPGGGPPQAQPPPGQQPQYGPPPQGPPYQGPPYQGPPPQGPPPQGAPPERRGSPVVLVLGIALGVVLLGVIGIGVFRTVTAGEDDPGLAVDRPIEAPSYSHPDTNGGPLGKAMLPALRQAGFACARQDGERDVFVYCHRSQADPAPTVQRIRMLMRDDQVLSIAADVRPDPAWTEAGEQIDVRPAASPVFGPIAGYAKYVMSPDDVKVFEAAIGDTVDGDRAEFNLSKGKGYFDISADKAKLYFTPDLANAAPGPGLPDGLESLTPAELEEAAESAGATCEARTEDSTSSSCKASEVELDVEFPVVDNGVAPMPGVRDRWVSKLEITGPASSSGAPDPALVELATAVTGVVGEKHGYASTPQEWVKGCFATQTNQSTFAYTEASCQPVLAEAGDAPTVQSFRLTIGAIPTW